MRNVLVIFKKQLKDTLKNKTILIQFVMFPVLTLIMEKAINISDMPEHFFTKLFAVMYIGMAPLTATASIIAEEKDKNTLRVLMMADMKPWQYLTGIGLYVWSICMIGAGVMSVNIASADRLFFLSVMALGLIISIIAGAFIGVFSKNQMMATSITLPLMIVCSFLPMLSMFNETIKKFSGFIYTQQLKLLFDKMTVDAISGSGYLIMGVNAVVCIILFVLAYKRKGLE